MTTTSAPRTPGSKLIAVAAGSTARYLILLVAVIVSMGPTAWVVLSSFKTANQVTSGRGFIPDPFTLQGYIDVFAQIRLHDYILNTLLYAGGGTLGALVLALLAAYPLARYVFRGSMALVAMFSLALALPLVGLATPEFFIVRELGLFDSRTGMTIFYSALMFPLCFVVLRSFLVSLPPELEEAAEIDGAGYLVTLSTIVVPLVRPALATTAVVSFVMIWNEFFFINLLTLSAENQNVQLALAGFQSEFGSNISGALAGTTLVLLVPVALFLLLQRQVIAGLTAGSLK